MITAQSVAECLSTTEPVREAAAPAQIPVPTTWRERLWTVPAETRLGVVEVAEALNRPRSWVYRHTSTRTGLSRLPHRKLDSELEFLAGEIRKWIKRNEEIIVHDSIALTLHSQRKGA
jgi:predicted DNA-binding transcriptional regulator AlpA